MSESSIVKWRDEPLPPPARERKWQRVAREVREASVGKRDGTWAVVSTDVSRSAALAAARELRNLGLDARMGYDEAADAFEVVARVHPPSVSVKPEDEPHA